MTWGRGGVLCKLETSAKKLGVCLPREGPAPQPSLPTQHPWDVQMTAGPRGRAKIHT